MKPSPERHDALRHIESLDALTDVEIDTLLVCGRERRLAIGDVLYEEGRPGDTMALLLDGALSVRRMGPRGTRVDLRTVAPGELIGELVCVDPAPRSATVVASAPSLLIEIDRAALEVLVERAPRIASHLLGMIIRATSQRLRRIDQQIAEEFGDPVTAPVEPPTRPTLPTAGARRRPSPVDPAKPGSPEPPAAATPSLWRSLVDRLRGGS